jgi:hypothetical protein
LAFFSERLRVAYKCSGVVLASVSWAVLIMMRPVHEGRNPTVSAYVSGSISRKRELFLTDVATTNWLVMIDHSIHQTGYI